MELLDAKRKLQLRLDAMTEEQYRAVKKCLTEGGGLLLTEGIDEKRQILLTLQDAIELLFDDCERDRVDFEQTVMDWTVGDWEMTIACLILQGELGRIKEVADLL